MSKKYYRFFGGLLTAQEHWLNKMSEKGYRLIRAEKMLYEFEACKPDQVKYCVEFIGQKSKANASDYHEFLEGMGYKVFYKNINLNYSVGKVRLRPWAEKGGRIATNATTFNRELLIVEKDNDGKPFELHTSYEDNKYLLLQSGMRLEVEEMQDTVYSDEKWVRFILNQLIANAVKYRTEQPVLRISTHKRQDQVVLVVEDNGIGIAASDLPRIFEKGFTGQNGRMVQQSTGIGLYLCKRLCEKLGIGITAESSEHGTAISLSFHINCLIHEVQS